jgi:ribosome-associated protein
MDTILSKSERKRRAKNIEQLVSELAALPDSEINSLPCEQEVQVELCAAKNLKGGAKKRQLKYATKLLRDMPVDGLFDYLAKKKGSLLKQNREFHDLEYMRDLLISEAVERYVDTMHNDRYVNDNEHFTFSWNSEALQIIIKQLPHVDQEILKTAAIQFAKTRNKKFSRELFRILKAAADKSRYAQKQDMDNGL